MNKIGTLTCVASLVARSPGPKGEGVPDWVIFAVEYQGQTETWLVTHGNSRGCFDIGVKKVWELVEEYEPHRIVCCSARQISRNMVLTRSVPVIYPNSDKIHLDFYPQDNELVLTAYERGAE